MSDVFSLDVRGIWVLFVCVTWHIGTPRPPNNLRPSLDMLLSVYLLIVLFKVWALQSFSDAHSHPPKVYFLTDCCNLVTCLIDDLDTPLNQPHLPLSAHNWDKYNIAYFWNDIIFLLITNLYRSPFFNHVIQTMWPTAVALQRMVKSHVDDLCASGALTGGGSYRERRVPRARRSLAVPGFRPVPMWGSVSVRAVKFRLGHEEQRTSLVR